MQISEKTYISTPWDGIGSDGKTAPQHLIAAFYDKGSCSKSSQSSHDVFILLGMHNSRRFGNFEYIKLDA